MFITWHKGNSWLHYAQLVLLNLWQVTPLTTFIFQNYTSLVSWQVNIWELSHEVAACLSTILSAELRNIFLHVNSNDSVIWRSSFPIPGFQDSTSGKESACQCGRHKRCMFEPWVGKIPWSRKWHPTPVFLPGKYPWAEKPGGLHSPWGCKELDMTEHSSTFPILSK